MASIITHPIIPLTLGLLATRAQLSWRLIIIGMLCAVVPDADVIGFKLGIPYDSSYGHRGFTHSLLFAALNASLITSWHKALRLEASLIWVFIFIATASHGALDALTNGGLGVEFLWPIYEERYFFAHRIIEVSPIGIKNFFNQRGWQVLQSELICIVLPCAVLILFSKILSHLKSR